MSAKHAGDFCNMSLSLFSLPYHGSPGGNQYNDTSWYIIHSWLQIIGTGFWANCVAFFLLASSTQFGLPWHPGHRTFPSDVKRRLTLSVVTCRSDRWPGPTVDGSEIRRLPVEVGRSSHYFQGFSTIQGACLGFLPSTVGPITAPSDSHNL